MPSWVWITLCLNAVASFVLFGPDWPRRVWSTALRWALQLEDAALVRVTEPPKPSAEPVEIAAPLETFCARSRFSLINAAPRKPSEEELKAMVGLQLEQYQSIVEELGDMPERWPDWVRQHHYERAFVELRRADTEAERAKQAWEAGGSELRSMIAMHDACLRRDRARQMFKDAATG